MLTPCFAATSLSMNLFGTLTASGGTPLEMSICLSAMNPIELMSTFSTACFHSAFAFSAFSASSAAFSASAAAAAAFLAARSSASLAASASSSMLSCRCRCFEIAAASALAASSLEAAAAFASSSSFSLAAISSAIAAAPSSADSRTSEPTTFLSPGAMLSSGAASCASIRRVKSSADSRAASYGWTTSRQARDTAHRRRKRLAGSPSLRHMIGLRHFDCASSRALKSVGSSCAPRAKTVAGQASHSAILASNCSAVSAFARGITSRPAASFFFTATIRRRNDLVSSGLESGATSASGAFWCASRRRRNTSDASSAVRGRMSRRQSFCAARRRSVSSGRSTEEAASALVLPGPAGLGRCPSRALTGGAKSSASLSSSRKRTGEIRVLMGRPSAPRASTSQAAGVSSP
mmetsp:Transcript_27349/g.81656  ORF Transcript_27349/g.81656 Transcript_27349/m.81656 type:complete len:407 (+) Transcript_27349:190-1410(+)